MSDAYKKHVLLIGGDVPIRDESLLDIANRVLGTGVNVTISRTGVAGSLDRYDLVLGQVTRNEWVVMKDRLGFLHGRLLNLSIGGAP